MRNIMLTIEYDGTNYGGWQIQKNKMTIQESVKKALEMVMNEEIDLIGASRTDSGVHASGQIANFKTNSSIEIERIPRALNSILPSDIVIKNAKLVSDNFHARFSSTGKKYRYIIRNSPTPSALNRNFEYFFPYSINIEDMKKACQYLIGTHDFSSFKAADSSVKDDIRTIYSIEINKSDQIIEIFVSGNGFLYNMVRIIVGTVLEVGNNRKSPEDIKSILIAKNRRMAGKTAPAHGLCLIEVYY